MRHLILIITILLTQPSYAQLDCSGSRYSAQVFSDYTITSNIIYATKPQSNGALQDLVYDVYMPEGDTVLLRPVILLAHGTAFVNLTDQTSPDMVRIAEEFVRHGYVVVSVEYREEPTFFSLLNEEAMVKAVARAMSDIHDAACHLVQSAQADNPFGIDSEHMFAGGVSAGALTLLQLSFLDSLSWVEPDFRNWILEVEPEMQSILDSRYCGAQVRGIVNISGALLDTSWIKSDRVDSYPALMHVHGTNDPIINYESGYPFGLTNYPKLTGSYAIDVKANSVGLRSELDTWPGYGHVPILGLNLPALFSDTPTDVIFDPVVLKATLNHMNAFMYSILDCDPITLPTAVNDLSQDQQVLLYPNPGSDNLFIRLPENWVAGPLQIVVMNAVGQTVYHQITESPFTLIHLNLELAPGYYSIRLENPQSQEVSFTGQWIKVR